MNAVVRVCALPFMSAALVVIAGCASIGPKAPEDAVRERAQARWDALIAGRFDDAYAYLSPATRQLITPQIHRARFGAAAGWKSAQVHQAKCDQADRCSVTIKITYQPALLRRAPAGTMESSVEETWLLDAGKWWLPQGL